MKNKLMALAIIGICIAVGMTSLLADAKPGNGKGPTEKATGHIEFTRDDGKYIIAEFNAHEAIGDRPAKGCYMWWNYNPDGTLYRNITVEILPTKVIIDGNTAWFAGECTYDSWHSIEGNLLYVYVEDNTTPGATGDIIAWKWGNPPDPIDDSRPIEEGNIVVHTYS